MTRINLFISNRQVTILKSMAEKLDVKFSELIRRAIDSYLDEVEDRKGNHLEYGIEDKNKDGKKLFNAC